NKRMTLSADIYKIDFNNKQVATPIQNATIYTNVGGATYQGFETEDTYYVGQGYSLYGNYSFNSAKVNTNNQWLPDAPEHTAAAGVIYNQGPVYASLLTKFVSSRYGDVGQTIPLGAYAVTNFATSYTIKHFASWAKDANIGFQINNMLNNQSIYALGTYDANNNAMYYTLPERSFQLTFSVSM
ncbi:MAG: TonB-dependent receptor domain-containing protein, partial [Burkholderiales bacterium]